MMGGGAMATMRGSARCAGMLMVLALGVGAGCGKKPPPADTNAGQAAPTKDPAPTKDKDQAKSAPPPPAGRPVDPSFERFSDTAADNQIDVPKDWTHNPVGDSLVIASPDKQVFIELSASLAMGKDKADEPKLMARLGKSLQKVKRVTPITKASQNGLSGWKFAGTAQKGGKPFDWESFALEDAAGKGAFGVVYASTSDLSKHRAVIDKILGSVSAITH